MKRLRAESLRNHENRLVAQSESEQQRNQGNLPGGYFVEPGEVFFFVTLCDSLLTQAVPDRELARREIAHQAEAASPAAGVPSKVDNQSWAVLKIRNGLIDFACHVDPDLAGKSRGLEHANTGFGFEP